MGLLFQILKGQIIMLWKYCGSRHDRNNFEHLKKFWHNSDTKAAQKRNKDINRSHKNMEVIKQNKPLQ